MLGVLTSLCPGNVGSHAPALDDWNPTQALRHLVAVEAAVEASPLCRVVVRWKMHLGVIGIASHCSMGGNSTSEAPEMVGRNCRWWGFHSSLVLWTGSHPMFS